MLVEKTSTTTYYAVETDDNKEISVTVMYDVNCDATTIDMMFTDDCEPIEEGTDLFNEVMEAIEE